MALEARMNQASEQQQNSYLSNGEIVTLTFNGVDVQCVAVNNVENSTVLVPLDSHALFESIPNDSTVQVSLPGGTINFQIKTYISIPAISGAFQKRRSVENMREYFRINTEFKIELTSDNATWSVKGEDISEGGLLAIDDGSIAVSVGQQVTVRIHLPDYPVLTAFGIIKRIENPNQAADSIKSKFAVQFTSMDYRDKQQLVEFIYRFQIKHAPCRSR